MNDDLFVDLGNSRIKWKSGTGHTQQAAEYDDAPFGALLDQIWKDVPAPKRIWLASVAAADIEQALQEWTRQVWRISPHPIAVQAEACGVRCGYQDPAQLGVDRWMAIIAAHGISRDGVCVVDCGTATTLDVVDGRGKHLGGYILPGIRMMRRILLKETAMKPGNEAAGFMEWGNSTASCIDLGIRKSVVSLIEQSVERLQATGVCDPGVVLTGGACPLIQPHLQLTYEHRDALVLEGMETFVQEHTR